VISGTKLEFRGDTFTDRAPVYFYSAGRCAALRHSALRSLKYLIRGTSGYVPPQDACNLAPALPCPVDVEQDARAGNDDGRSGPLRSLLRRSLRTSADLTIETRRPAVDLNFPGWRDEGAVISATAGTRLSRYSSRSKRLSSTSRVPAMQNRYAPFWSSRHRNRALYHGPLTSPFSRAAFSSRRTPSLSLPLPRGSRLDGRESRARRPALSRVHRKFGLKIRISLVERIKANRSLPHLSERTLSRLAVTSGDRSACSSGALALLR